MTAVTLPSPAKVWEAAAHWSQVDFISDLHLAPELPKTLATLRQYLSNTHADALVILGDLFEVWVGDDARYSDFEAEVTALLVGASQQRTVAFMAGNRDFLLGTEMAHASGMMLLADPAVMVAWDQRILLTHGDAWCLADEPYQQFRRLVRSPEWQREFLSRPLNERRAQARSIREESQRRKQSSQPIDWGDIDFPTAEQALRQSRCNILIHGHTHRPSSESVATGLVRHVLSDWDMDCAQAPRAEVLQWRPDGIRRRALLP
jgi:UDP-2,3-diacylglucosamine hydrolase